MESGAVDALRDILDTRSASWEKILPQLKREGRYHAEVY